MALASSTPVAEPHKKKKGPKGPNPLSVKKKKTKTDAPGPPLTTDKGKTKVSAIAVDGNETANVGEKRKRKEPSEIVEGHDRSDETGAAHEGGSGGRKRKRRRKTAASTATNEPAITISSS